MTVLEQLKNRQTSKPTYSAPASSSDAMGEVEAKKVDALKAKAKGK